jgi:hypothetical protein
MSIIVPHASTSTFILPPPPAGTSSTMVCAIDRYASEFLLDNDEGAWTAAAQAVVAQQPVTTMDAAAKLLVIAHYMNPEIVDGQPAIDLAAFDCDTGHMLLQCVADLLMLSEAGR